MNSSLPRHDVVLLGVGHTNAHVLRMWRMAPVAEARLTCISDQTSATYSGMLPGTLAGLYPPERMQIDLVRLCAAAGARLIRGRVAGLDRERRQVILDDRPPVPYDVLSIGIGSLSHLAVEALAIKSGTKLVHVPYPSSPAAVTAIIRGDVQLGCLPAISLTPHAEAGKVKILAVSTAKRSPYLPNVPTLKESGIDVEADAWMGMIAPGRIPEAMLAKIHRDVAAAVLTPAVRAKLATQLMQPIGNSPAEFRAAIAAEIARWAPVIQAANIRVN